MNTALTTICVLLVLIAPRVFTSPVGRLYPGRADDQLRQELTNDIVNNDNFLDLRFETEVGKRSEIWQKLMKRSHEYTRDLNKLTKNDLKSIMKLKGKLTRVSDGIRFLVN